MPCLADPEKHVFMACYNYNTPTYGMVMPWEFFLTTCSVHGLLTARRECWMFYMGVAGPIELPPPFDAIEFAVGLKALWDPMCDYFGGDQSVMSVSLCPPVRFPGGQGGAWPPTWP